LHPLFKDRKELKPKLSNIRAERLIWIMRHPFAECGERPFLHHEELALR
jgi:hypothetical protein